MKRKSLILFIATFVFGVLACSLVTFLLFNVSMKENEEKVKEIKVSTNEMERDDTTPENVIESNLNQESIDNSQESTDKSQESTNKGQESTKQNQDYIEDNQENIDNIENETGENDDNILISGSIDKSIFLGANIQTITVNSAIDEVLIYQTDNEELEITQTYKNLYKKDLFTVSEETGELVITTTSTGDNLQLPGSNSLTRKSTLEVKLPEGFSGTLEVRCDVGSITIKDQLKVEELNLANDIGDITILKEQNLKKANLHCDIGNITVKDAWNVEDSTFNVEVGNVSLSKTISGKKLEVLVQIGNVVVPREAKENKEFLIKADLGAVKGY